MQHFDRNKLDWHRAAWAQLLGQGLGRLPHAMLLVGPAGVGKTAFAEQLAGLLLCEAIASGVTACGACQACAWLEAGNHPDFRRVEPEGDDEVEEGANEKPGEKSKKRSQRTIHIREIRELEPFVFVGSHRDGNRVVLVSEAEAMNPAAANALLKILEEPPPSVYFIIVSSRQKALLPTILSRCRIIPMGPPEPAAATAWLSDNGLDDKAERYLNLAGGAPLRVRQWYEQGHLAPIDALVESLISPPADPIVLAGRWDALLKGEAQFGMESLVEGVQRWLFDLAQERMTGEIRYHGGWGRPKGVRDLSPKALLAAWRDINQFRRSARHPLNQLLFLENLAAHYLRGVRPAAS